MVLKCKYCGKRDGVEGRTLHKFPLKDTETLKLWLQQINLGSTFVPTNNSRLCSEHFRKECFDKKDTRVNLHPGSIPSLFGEPKSACAYCNASKGEDKHCSLQKFPLDNSVLLEKWRKAIKLPNYVPHKKNILCNDHFDKNCFYTVPNTSYLRLKSNAIPSIFKALEDPQLNHNSKKRLSLEPSLTTKHRRLSSDSSRPVYMAKEGISPREFESVLLQLEAKMETCDFPAHLATEDCSFNEDSEMQAPVSKQVTSVTSIPVTPTTSKSNHTLETPQTDRRKKLLHDHSYETTPKRMKRKLFLTERKLKVLQQESEVQKQHIGRLRRKIRTLKDIVSELHRTRAIPESGLACLEVIADSDVSQLLQRFIKNKKNLHYSQSIIVKRVPDFKIVHR